MSAEGPEQSPRPGKPGQGAYTAPPSRPSRRGPGLFGWLAAGALGALIVFPYFSHNPGFPNDEQSAQAPTPPAAPAVAQPIDSTHLTRLLDGEPAADDEVRPVPATPARHPETVARTAPARTPAVPTRVDLHWLHDNDSEDLYRAGVKVVVDGVSWGLQKLEVRKQDHLTKMRFTPNQGVPSEVARMVGSDARIDARSLRVADHMAAGDPTLVRNAMCSRNRATQDKAWGGTATVGAAACPSWSATYNHASLYRLILPVIGDEVPHTAVITKVAMVQGPETSANLVKTAETFRREAGPGNAWRLVDTRTTVYYSHKKISRYADGRPLELWVAPDIAPEDF